MNKKVIKEIKAILLLAILTVIFSWKIIFTGEYTLMAYPDLSVHDFAMRELASNFIKQGILPLWDPYTYGGHTFIGEGQSGLFYPLNLIQSFILTGDARTDTFIIEIFIIIGFFLAATFQYLFSRTLGLSSFSSIVSAISFAFGGYIVCWSTGALGMFNGAIWIPLILLFFLKAFNDKRLLARVWFSNIAGIFLGFSILAGHFQPPIHITLLLGIFILYRTFVLYKDAGWFRPLGTGIVNLAVCLSVAVCFAGVQTLPSFEYAAHALRWIGASAPLEPGQKVPYEIAGTFSSLHPQGILSFLIPRMPWVGIYFGILPFVLSIIAIIFKRSFLVKFFLLISVLFIFYAIGDSSIAHGIGYAFVPFLEKVRTADRAVYLSHFGLAVLAGFGAEFLISPFRKNEKRKFLIFTRITSFFGAVVFTICLAFSCWLWVFRSGNISNNYLNNLYFFLLFLSTVVAILYIRYFGYLKLRTLKVLMVSIIIFDLYAAFNGSVLLKNKHNLYPGEYYKETAVTKFLRSQEGYFRIDNVKNALPANFGDFFGLQSTMGYSATMFKDYYEFKILGWFPPSRGSDLLNVRYAVTKEPLTGLKLIMDGDIKVYENESYLPRAWLTTNYEVIEDVKKVYKRLREKTFDYRNTIVVNKEPPRFFANAQNDNEKDNLHSSVNIESYHPTKIILNVNTNMDAFLVLSEIFYPGWKVTIDEEEASMYRVNGILRGAIIPEGDHVVEFVYSPITFKIGGILTVLSLVSLCVLSFWISWNEPRITISSILTKDRF